MQLLAVCGCLVSLMCVSNAENLQRWSHWTELGVDLQLTCNDTYGDVFIDLDDQLEWKRHGESNPIVADDHHEFTDWNGINKMMLTLKSINEDMKGIYLCEVSNSSGHWKGTVVKGLNLGGHKYESGIDKYDSQLIVGVIAGAAVFVFIVSVGLIDRYQYLTDEQKQKKKERKEELNAKMHRWNDSGELNKGYDNEMRDGSGKTNEAFSNGGDQKEINTHL